MSDIRGRITAYLTMGGTWTPEFAHHKAVSDLLFDARARIEKLEAEVERLREERNYWIDAAKQSMDDLDYIIGRR